MWRPTDAWLLGEKRRFLFCLRVTDVSENINSHTLFNYNVCALAFIDTFHAFLYCIVLYCIVLYCIVLYCIVLYCIVLYCIVLYCIVLYCIVLASELVGGSHNKPQLQLQVTHQMLPGCGALASSSCTLLGLAKTTLRLSKLLHLHPSPGVETPSICI